MTVTQLTPLSEAQHEVVKAVYEAIGVLTVRDKTTYPDSTARPYGEQYVPVSPHPMTGQARPDPKTRHRRVIHTVFPESLIYPGGIPLGMTEFWQPKGIAELGGDPTLTRIVHKPDICFSEMSQLKSHARGTRWMSKAERDADEREKEELRQKRNKSDLDPASATGKAIAEALATAIGTAKSAPADTGTSLLAKQRIVMMDGKRRRRWVIEDGDENRIDGPFSTKDEAIAKIKEMDE